MAFSATGFLLMFFNLLTIIESPCCLSVGSLTRLCMGVAPSTRIVTLDDALRSHVSSKIESRIVDAVSLGIIAALVKDEKESRTTRIF